MYSVVRFNSFRFDNNCNNNNKSNFLKIYKLTLWQYEISQNQIMIILFQQRKQQQQKNLYFTTFECTVFVFNSINYYNRPLVTLYNMKRKKNIHTQMLQFALRAHISGARVWMKKKNRPFNYIKTDFLNNTHDKKA